MNFSNNILPAPKAYANICAPPPQKNTSNNLSHSYTCDNLVRAPANHNCFVEQANHGTEKGGWVKEECKRDLTLIQSIVLIG